MKQTPRWTPLLLVLAPLAAPVPSAAQLLSSEILYVSQSRKNNQPFFEVMRRPVNGSTPTRVIGGCLVPATYCTYADPVVSPDGHRVAFVFEPVTEQFCKTIWIAGINGANPRQVAMGGCAHKRPTWSPDGSRIAYESGGAIYEVGLCGTALPERNPRRIGAGTSPSYSRDGRHLVFERNGDIWKRDIQGGTEANLTRTGTAEWEPRWTKAGSPADLIVFLSGSRTKSDVHTMDANGQNRKQVTTTATAKRAPDVGLLPTLIVWEESEQVLFKLGSNPERVVTSGRSPFFGGSATSVTTCP